MSLRIFGHFGGLKKINDMVQLQIEYCIHLAIRQVFFSFQNNLEDQDLSVKDHNACC